MNTQALEDFVTNWRANNGITGNQPLTTAQIQTFAIDLQAQVGQFSVRPEGAGWSPTAQPLGYQGWIDNIPNWKIAQAIAHSSKRRVGKGFSCPPSVHASNDCFLPQSPQLVVGKQRARLPTLRLLNNYWRYTHESRSHC